MNEAALARLGDVPGFELGTSRRSADRCVIAVHPVDDTSSRRSPEPPPETLAASPV